MSNKLLKFSATWCSPCKEMSERLKTIDYPIVEIDADDNLDTLRKYGVRGVPTLIMVDDNDKELARLVGSKPTAELKEWIAKHQG